MIVHDAATTALIVLGGAVLSAGLLGGILATAVTALGWAITRRSR